MRTESKDNIGRNTLLKQRLWATSGTQDKIYSGLPYPALNIHDKINWRSSYVVSVMYRGEGYEANTTVRGNNKTCYA